MYNGDSFDNYLPLNICENPLKLLFNGGTTVTKIHILEIHAHKFKFKPILDFLEGKLQNVMLYGISSLSIIFISSLISPSFHFSICHWDQHEVVKMQTFWSRKKGLCEHCING